MSNFNITSRYASALFKLAEEKTILNQIASDMDLISNTLLLAKDLKTFLKSPIIQVDKKREVLAEIFSGKITGDSHNFLNFLIQKGRENLLLQIAQKFNQLVDKKNNMITVKVISAMELNVEQKNLLKNKIEVFTGKKVKFLFKIDDKLIGGFLLRIDDTVMDASIKRQLELLQIKLLADNAIVN